jgi:hypothetical protein
MLHMAPINNAQYSRHVSKRLSRHCLQCCTRLQQTTLSTVDTPSNALHATAWSVPHGPNKIRSLQSTRLQTSSTPLTEVLHTTPTNNVQYRTRHLTGPTRHWLSVDATLQRAGSHVLPHNKLTIIPRVMALHCPQTAHMIALPRRGEMNWWPRQQKTVSIDMVCTELVKCAIIWPGDINHSSFQLTVTKYKHPWGLLYCWLSRVKLFP